MRSFNLYVADIDRRERHFELVSDVAARVPNDWYVLGELAFTSEETGRPEIVVASLDGASQRQVSSEGGYQPRWRGDGQELFYLSLRGELMSAGITPGQAITVGQRRPLFSHPVGSGGSNQYGPEYDVTANGQRFLFNVGAESAQAAFVVRFGWQRDLKP